MDTWRLSNAKKQRGMLGEAGMFVGSCAEQAASSVSVPLECDEDQIRHGAPGLISGTIRSFELWWDGERKELSCVLATTPDDLPVYRQAFSNMYPAARYAPLERHTPAWFDRRVPYRFFDVGLYHGHYASPFRADEAPWVISNLAGTIQQGRFAWIQFVFCAHDFTPFLNSHLVRLNALHQTMKNRTAGGIISGLVPGMAAKPDQFAHVRPGDFEHNFPALLRDATKKMQGRHAMVSVRGLVDAGTVSETDMVGAISFDSIRSEYDYLTTYPYRPEAFFTHDLDRADYIRVGQHPTARQRIDMFSYRLMPDARECAASILDRYARRGLAGGYRARRPPPFLIALPAELPLFVHLPKPSTPNIRTTRGQVLPSQQTDKSGYNAGYFEPRDKFDCGGYYRQFGRQCVSSDAGALTISPGDFAYHVYMPGGTGSGKSSMIKVIAKHLEVANIYYSLPRDVPVSQIPLDHAARDVLSGLDGDKTLEELNLGWPNAFIYFDPKGDDSEMFIRQCEPYTIGRGLVHYLDPSRTKFSINPLELPPYDKDSEGARDELVALYVGYFFEMIKGWYGNSEAFVRMNRIMRNLLEYLYLNDDSPTFTDLHSMILRIQDKKRNHLQAMYDSLGRPSGELDAALRSIATMDAKSFEPVLNRLDIFAVNASMRHMFCRRKSTVQFREIIQPGHYTVVRFSESDIPMNVINLAMQTFVLKLWFEVLARSSRVPIRERTQVVLALDEFQKVKGISVLETMIAQARSKGLGLVLAHQSLKQLDEGDLSGITTNFGIQMAGHLEGSDAQRLAMAWDPKYVEDIKNMIATQAKYRWTARAAPSPGEEQPLPVQFWTHFDPASGEVCRPNMGQEEWKAFVASERRRYGTDAEERTFLDAREEERNRWKMNMDAALPPHDFWHVMLMLRPGPLNLKGITLRYNPRNDPTPGTRHRDEISATLRAMVADGLLAKEDRRDGRYSLAASSRECFSYPWEKIGTAPDVKDAVREAVRYYLGMGYFLAMADQRIRKDVDRTDMVAYDYNTDTPISVEVESVSEQTSHAEHVRYNMVKWPELGFRKCHVWSFNPGIEQERESLGNDTRGDTVVFVLYRDGRPARIVPPDGPGPAGPSGTGGSGSETMPTYFGTGGPGGRGTAGRYSHDGPGPDYPAPAESPAGTARDGRV